jgi:N-acetylglucosaminyl-diphospho-decaprenol L-rhamnosyltransferase
MHVAVAIVGFCNTDDIVRCLAALTASEHRDFEVVICENGGPEAYKRLIVAVPPTLGGGQPVRIMRAPNNLGFAGGVNVCLKETPDADAWWILNPDTSPPPRAMAALVGKLQDGSCDAVGGPLYLGNGTVQSYGGLWQGWPARAVSIGHGGPQNAPIDAAAIERRQNYLNGASMLIGRRFIQTTGLMREDYFLYCEEVEWCLRARTLGLRLGFAPDAAVLHFQGTTTGAGGRVADRSRISVYLVERNKMLLTRDRYPARLPVAVVATLVIIASRYGRAGAWKQMGYGLAGVWAGLLNRRGPPTWTRS